VPNLAAFAEKLSLAENLPKMRLDGNSPNRKTSTAEYIGSYCIAG